MSCPRTKTARSREGGFTLVELLVVISVIGVLLGLLLPALGMGKRKANDAHCRGNLRQLGLAVRTWADEHEERFPVVGADQPNAAGTNVQAVLGFMTNSAGVFRCREDREQFQETGSSYDWNSGLNGRLIDRPGAGASSQNAAQPLLYDHLPWHGHQNAVFADGRVDRMK